MRLLFGKKFLLVFAACLVSGLLFVLGWQVYERQRQEFLNQLEPCRSPSYWYTPTIKEIGPGFIALEGDSKAVLAPHQSYTIKFGAFELYYELLEFNEQNATFYYSETINSPGEFDIPPSVSKIQCKMVIDFSNATYQARENSLWPQPSEFSNDWQVKQYIEYTRVSPAYRPPALDYYEAILIVDHQMADGKTVIPYNIIFTVSSYENETMAVEAFTGAEAELASRVNPRHKVGLEVHFDRYSSYCYYDYSYMCKYVGQWNNQIAEIEMFIPHRELPRVSVPLEDWQYIVSLAESKVTNNH